jgi:predicted anti-sigma-YlaC factor YlaD
MTGNEVNCEACEQQLFDFHEGRLTGEAASQVDAHLKHCDACSALLNDIWQMSLAASRWQDQRVPDWDRKSAFFEGKRWQFPQLLATAASLLALVLVLTDVHFVSGDGGITLRMGRGDYVSVSTLDQFRDIQQAQLEQGFDKLTAQQVASNQLMLGTMLDTSRKERREDFSTLVTYWNGIQARQYQETEENLRYLLATQAEDERDIQQLGDALQQISLRRGTDM